MIKVINYYMLNLTQPIKGSNNKDTKSTSDQKLNY
jgi:hypothetical protein